MKCIQCRNYWYIIILCHFRVKWSGLQRKSFRKANNPEIDLHWKDKNKFFSEIDTTLIMQMQTVVLLFIENLFQQIALIRAKRELKAYFNYKAMTSSVAISKLCDHFTEVDNKHVYKSLIVCILQFLNVLRLLYVSHFYPSPVPLLGTGWNWSL